MPALCRDCFHLWATEGACPRCGGARTLAHSELDALDIAHLDCDAFYAAVELRDNPALASKPLIIGGSKRGVVSTCCYQARKFGVRSAMPMYQARRLCPDATVLPPDMSKYAHEARRVRELMLAYTPAVEPLSIDEAFIDMSGTTTLHGAPPAVSLARLSRRIEDEIGITVSIGLAYNKFLAKVASEVGKPRGYAVIGRGDAMTFLAPRSVSVIYGVGKVLAATLAKDGITTVAHLQALDKDELVRRYGKIGGRLSDCSRGIDSREVIPEGESKGLSAETTFEGDISDGEQLGQILWRLCEKLSSRLKTAEMAGRTVVLKLKTSDFRLRTRSQTLTKPTQLAETLYRTGHALLMREVSRTRYRLLGIGVHDVSPPAEADSIDLFDGEARRRADVERTIDRVRERFGEAAIAKGRGFRPAVRKPPAGED